MGAGNFTLGSLVKISFAGLTSEEDLADVEDFFKDKDTKTYSQALAQGLDGFRAKIAWLKRDAQGQFCVR